MGQTIFIVKIHGPNGTAEVEALVDTRATFTKLPPSAIEQTGVQPSYETDVELADGRTVTPYLAPAEVEINGVRRIAIVAIGEEREHALIGLTTLGTLGFKVNPVTESIEPTLPIEY